MNFKVITFLALVILIVLKYYKIFNINVFWIIGVFCVWFVSVYFSIHFKNKELATPRPVYNVDYPTDY